MHNNLYKGEIWTQTHGENAMLSITGVMSPQAKELLEAKREAWNRSFSSAFRGSLALPTP